MRWLQAPSAGDRDDAEDPASLARWPADCLGLEAGLIDPARSEHYSNSEAQLVLRAPEGWRRLSYQTSGWVTFVAPRGRGNVEFLWVEAPEGPLREAPGLPERFGDAIRAVGPREVEPYTSGELVGVKRSRTYETTSALGVMEGARVVAEEVCLPWRGKVLVARWRGAEAPPAGTWEAFFADGLRRDLPAELDLVPSELPSLDAWLSAAEAAGTVSAGVYVNPALGLRFSLPPGLEQRSPGTFANAAGDEALGFVATVEPMGQPLLGFVRRTRPPDARDEIELFEFAGRPAAGSSYEIEAQLADGRLAQVRVHQFLVRDHELLLAFTYTGPQASFDALVASLRFDPPRKPLPAR